MSTFEEAQERDMVLFVGSYLDSQKKALKTLGASLDKTITPLVLIQVGLAKHIQPVTKDSKAIVIEVDEISVTKIQTALKPYISRIIAVTTRGEKNIPLLKKVIPYVPYLNTPTTASLDWTTDKIKMRQLLRNYDKSISPKFLVVHDASKETIERIGKRIGFPLVIKPAGLAKSLLVTLCFHEEELEENLKNTVAKIKAIYKKENGRGEPSILVEEFMEGTMYSIDCYVNHRGVVYYTPLVNVKTGYTAGYEDFFGYMRITPVQLKPYKIEHAKHAAQKAIDALGLRSTTCHIELMKTEDGWKVIELGPRIGGFRHEMYEFSYGIDHSLNDILIRIPKKPILAKRAKGYTVVMQFYPKKKGRLQSLEGVNKVRRLASFERIGIKKKIGEMCNFARNGDDPVFDLVLFNKNRSNLLADIRRVETAVKIVTATTKAK
jgi:biotin carboxylase